MAYTVHLCDVSQHIKLTGENGLRQRRREREREGATVAVYICRGNTFFPLSFALLACSCFKHDTGSVSKEEICAALNIQISSRLVAWTRHRLDIWCKIKADIYTETNITALVFTIFPEPFSLSLMCVYVEYIFIYFFLCQEKTPSAMSKTQWSQAFRFVFFSFFFLLPWKDPSASFRQM